MELGLKGKQLAELVGISAPYLTQLEKGLREPSGDLLNKLARSLDTTPDLLLSGKSVMRTRKVAYQTNRDGVIPGTLSIQEQGGGYLGDTPCKNCELLRAELDAVSEQLKRANAVIDCFVTSGKVNP
jgi:transcriptional regulator with XRE-family HTH domain